MLKLGHYDGGKKEGQKAEYLRHGHGTYIYPNEYFYYSGQWVDNKKQGEGVFQLGDGGFYEGEFQDGEICGNGLRKWPSGASYSGQFQDGELNGQGVYLGADGSKYEGAFMNNLKWGYGQETMPDGAVYAGYFIKQKRDGTGTLTSTDGSKYDGEFSKGVRCGEGRQDYPEGDTYEGQWSHDCHHGTGRHFEYSTGIVYNGHWVDGARKNTPTKLAVERPPPPEQEEGEPPVEYDEDPAHPVPAGEDKLLPDVVILVQDCDNVSVDAESRRYIVAIPYVDRAREQKKLAALKKGEVSVPDLKRISFKSEARFGLHEVGVETENGKAVFRGLQLPDDAVQCGYQIRFFDRTDHPNVPLEPTHYKVDVL